MPKDGSLTRRRILDVAHAAVMKQGFAAVSVDSITTAAGVTKGAFFHHFESKAALGRALLERYAKADVEHLEAFMARAEKLSRDPLQQVLLFAALLEEALESQSEPEDPGCLYASYCYESQVLDDEARAVIHGAVSRWRSRFGDKVREAARAHPPRLEVDLDAVVDLYWTIFEGAFILARVTGDPNVVVPQLRQYRNYLELLFGATPASGTVDA